MVQSIKDYAFPPDKDDDNDSLSLKKLVNKEGEWALLKDMLGFDFDGDLKIEGPVHNMAKFEM